MERKLVRKEIQSPTNPKKTFFDVFYYLPNLLDFFRLYLVLTGFFLDNYFNLRVINAVFYVFSHFLDLYDGALAWYMNQCSKFGIVLDYTVDILTEVIWYIQLAPLVGVGFKTLMVYAITIDMFGLVFCVYNSASGSYWKGSSCRPKWQEPFINEKGYTRLGYSIVIWYQVFWATLYLSYFYSIHWTILTLLGIPMIFELSSLTMILYEQIMLFRE